LANSMLDILQIMRSLLFADSVMTGMVGDAIYTSHILDADAGTAPLPAFILSLDNGTSMYNGQVQFQDIEAYGYSRISAAEAMSVYQAGYNVLQANRLTLDNVSAKGYIYEINRPDSGYNDRIKAWFVRGRFHAVTAG
jgi:hypothetical protein